MNSLAGGAGGVGWGGSGPYIAAHSGVLKHIDKANKYICFTSIIIATMSKLSTHPTTY